MRRTKKGSIAIGIASILAFSFFAQGCNLGKKNCGCGMDLNGSVRKKHWYSRN